MYFFIFLGPLFFSIGSLCWTDILANDERTHIQNIISLIISVIIILLPYDEIRQKIMQGDDEIKEKIR